MITITVHVATWKIGNDYVVVVNGEPIKWIDERCQN
jgi:hypothetical protein